MTIHSRSLCTERCTRSEGVTIGLALRDLGKNEVTRALVPALLVLLNSTIRN
jgi:hypothetical protein